MIENTEIPPPNLSSSAYAELGPNEILTALESAGWWPDGRVNALNSYENRVYLIGIEDENPVVAKFYRPGRWTDACINEEHLFTEQLREHDLPVVCAHTNAAGEWLLHYDQYRFCVYPRAGGRPPELDNPEQLETIGRTLARMHSVGELQKYTDREQLDVESRGNTAVSYLTESEHLPDDMRETYIGVANDLLNVIKQQFSACGNVQQLRIHGDFHPGNILWGADDTPHLLDFDDTCMGPAVQDLWMFLSGDRQYRNERLGDLLVGYEQFREFDTRELQLIEPLRTLRLLNYAAWIALRWEDPAFKQAFPFFGERRFWDEHVLSLREQRAALDEAPLVWD